MTKAEAIKVAREMYPGHKVTAERFNAGIRGWQHVLVVDGDTVARGVDSWDAAVERLTCEVDGKACRVERLMHQSPTAPKWEVHAPEHHHFGCGSHSIVGYILSQVVSDAKGDGIVRCSADCDCQS